jgi:protein-disulfide isomerase
MAALADKMGFPGTPVFLVGPLPVQEARDLDGFKRAEAQARARAAGR